LARQGRKAYKAMSVQQARKVCKASKAYKVQQDQLAHKVM
jgi:hypothetical protein